MKPRGNHYEANLNVYIRDSNNMKIITKRFSFVQNNLSSKKGTGTQDVTKGADGER
jgi:hypothetical protein